LQADHAKQRINKVAQVSNSGSGFGDGNGYGFGSG